MTAAKLAEALEAEELPIKATDLAKKLGLQIEDVYRELVSFEARGLAEPVINYTRRGTGKYCVAGWIYIG